MNGWQWSGLILLAAAFTFCRLRQIKKELSQSTEQLSLIVRTQQEIATEVLDLPTVMRMIVKRACELTSAQGAVIEILEGDEMVVKAGYGILANSVGERFPRAGRASGFAIQKGEILEYQDVEKDFGEDAAWASLQGIGAMVVAPLVRGRGNVGVLKVASMRKGTFKSGESVPLQLLAGLLGAAMDYAAEIQDKQALLATRTRTLEKVKEAESQFRALSEAAFEGICLIDHGVIVEVNEPFCQMFGFSASELKGRKFNRLIHSRDSHSNLQEPDRRFEFLGIKKDGEIVDMEAVGSDCTYRGKAARVVAVRDISERKRFERELIHAREAALEGARSKSVFLAKVSHELRTPLNGVTGLSHLLEGTDLSDEQKEYVQGIRQSADSLLAIINDILDLSKFEAGKMVFERISFNLGSILELLQKTHGQEAARKGLGFEVCSRLNGVLSYLGDPNRILQVLNNLVGNAVKFTESGRVRVEVFEQSDTRRVRFEVQDTGVGIASTAMEKLFLPFSQADISTTRRFGGTGLGLAISKNLVEGMSGQLGVESVEGVGSLFWFEIPLEAEKREAPDQALVAKPEYAHLNILIAEDHPINQKVTLKLVERLQCRGTLVSNGIQAIEELESSGARYDLVLMDCHMPEMDGFEATRRIRASNESHIQCIPVIAMTALSEGEAWDKCLQVGMDDFLPKPVDPSQLVQKIQKWMKLGQLDLQVLDQLKSMDGLLDQLVVMFHQLTPARIQAIRAAVARGDAESLMKEAHGLKSGSASLGARAVSALAAKLEGLGREGRTDGAQVYIESLEQEFIESCRGLDKYIGILN